MASENNVLICWKKEKEIKLMDLGSEIKLEALWKTT